MAQQIAKRLQIQKSMSNMVKFASIAAFLFIFSLSSSHALWNKLTFQNKVISDKTTARNQLQADVMAANKLTNSYKSFNNAQTNLLGGTVSGVDNDNSKDSFRCTTQRLRLPSTNR
ncbi:MAG: hypothetical protein WDN66_01980 [Candidatus Saccharibacteria bacterium]